MSGGADSTDPASSSSAPAAGSIPLSWARPAEDVSDDVPSGSRAPFVIVLVLAIAIAGVVAVGQAMTAAPPPSVTAPVEAPVAALPAPITSAPEPAANRVITAPVAPEDDDGVAAADPVAAPVVAAPIDDADRKRARVLLRAARFAAKDGDFDRASALAEDAVDKDPRCAECWATVAFLRKRAGDLDGFSAARLQARALAP
ncbi:MAG: hypothetical protein Q8O67_06370 [Deltaproteobacteria bacterium]|nr:hypothetical protein [Deltaproteobacteria bacterium]